MKKIFSLFAAALMTTALMAADFTPTTVYKAGDASTLGSSWASKNQTTNYFESGDTTIFCAYLCYQSQGASKQSWTGSIGNGSTSSDLGGWGAMDVFKGKDGWFSSSPACATVRNTRTYLYNVTNCSEVRILGDNKGGNREYYLKAFRIHNGEVESTPTDSVCNTANSGSFVLAINGLNVADTFRIVVTTNTNSNSNLYEIAFISAPAATNVATLKDIAVDGTSLEGFSAEVLTYNVELPYGATVVPTVTATPTLSNEHVNITPAASVPGATTIAVTSADSTVSLTYTVNFTVSTVQSTDATLSSLKVSNKAVGGFRADSLTYTYSVAYLDTVIPQISAELNDETASLIITQATAVPGAATVLVTAQAGNTLTYTVNFVRLDAEKNVKEIMMNNWYYAYQINDSAHLDTIYAHYVAGTPQPTIYNYVVSEGASFASANNQIVVTGADNTTRSIPFAVTPVTPYVAGNDTIWFDGSENYVICPYGFDTSKGGFKFSKTDTDYSREWAGKTHVDIFLTEADSIYLIGGNTTNRKVKVRINDVVTAEGNLGSSANMWVPVRRSAPFCMSIISSQSSGDGAVKGIVVVHVAQGFTGCRDIQSEDTVRKYIRNGEIVIERNGIIYSVTGQKR